MTPDTGVRTATFSRKFSSSRVLELSMVFSNKGQFSILRNILARSPTCSPSLCTPALYCPKGRFAPLSYGWYSRPNRVPNRPRIVRSREYRLVYRPQSCEVILKGKLSTLNLCREYVGTLKKVPPKLSDDRHKGLQPSFMLEVAWVWTKQNWSSLGVDVPALGVTISTTVIMRVVTLIGVMVPNGVIAPGATKKQKRTYLILFPHRYRRYRSGVR